MRTDIEPNYETDVERIEREEEDNQRVNDLFNRFWVKSYLEGYKDLKEYIKTLSESITIIENEDGSNVDMEYKRFVLARNKAHDSLNSVKNHLYLVCLKNKHPDDFSKVMILFKQRYPQYYNLMSVNICDLILEPRVCPAFKSYCNFDNEKGCPLSGTVKWKIQEGCCKEDELDEKCRINMKEIKKT